MVGWNGATDSQTPPTKYNIYWTDTLPFNIGLATKIANVTPSPGTSTKYQCYVSNLPAGKLLHFVVRAEDQVGNEDTNLVVKDATTASSGDPSHPIILATYSIYGSNSLSLSGNILTVADYDEGLKVYDRTDPINLKLDSAWTGDSVYSVVCDGNFAYCGGYDYFSSIDITNPKSPVWTGYFACSDANAVAKSGNYVYVTDDYDYLLYPVDVTDPHNIKVKTGVYYPGDYGYVWDMKLTPNYIYIADNYTGILSMKLNSPSSPVYSTTFGDMNTTGLAINGNTLFSTDSNAGKLWAYNIGSNPANPPLLSSNGQGSGTEGSGVVIVGNYAYLGRFDWGIVTFDISNPSSIKYMGGVAVQGIEALITDGTLIYAVAVNPDTYAGYLYVII